MRRATSEREGDPGGRAGPSSSHISIWPSGSCSMNSVHYDYHHNHHDPPPPPPPHHHHHHHHHQHDDHLIIDIRPHSTYLASPLSRPERDVVLPSKLCHMTITIHDCAKMLRFLRQNIARKQPM